MICKHCGAELVEGKPFCPSCGKSQEDAPEMTEIQAEPEAAEVQDQPETKASPGKIALAVAAVVVVLALLIALVVGGAGGSLFGGTEETAAPTQAPTEPVETVPATTPPDGNPDDVTCKGTYSVSDEEAIAAADTVVATMGGKELTNGELQVYYWEEIYTFLNEYASYAAYFGLDYSKPLDVQMCSVAETPMTWQQYFLDCAIKNWQSYQSLALEAEENEFVMDDDTKAYLEGVPADMDAMAAEQGYESTEAMVRSFVGAGPSIEDYLNYIVLYNEGFAYFSHVYDNTTPTAEEVEAYFTENEASYAEEGVTRDSGKYVDVRHILIMPEGGETGADGYPVYTDEAWEAARVEAENLYNQWKNGDKSEDSFAQYAQEHSVDGSASNGGLYTDVYVGQMVPAFNDWCFDETRQVGDHGLVKTEYGYHIMFFSGSTEIWYATAETDMINEKVAALVPAAMEKFPIEVDFGAIKIGVIDLV